MIGFNIFSENKSIQNSFDSKSQNSKDTGTNSTNKAGKKNIGFSWISKILCAAKLKKSTHLSNLMEPEEKPHQRIPVNDCIGAYSFDKDISSNSQEEKNHYNSSTSSSDSHEKDIVPLRQYLRYTMKRSDRRAFQRRRIIQPFQPKYEVEWQKNQWLQLDHTTSKDIERLRKIGFSKIAIRKDTSLKKYVVYDNPSDIDVLLEISLNENVRENSVEYESQPILCHQPTRFNVRRTYWWRVSYKIGEAHLPIWVDSDLCCNAMLMDASSVLAAMTNGSRTSLSSSTNNNTNIGFPDTPALSQKSSVNHLSTSPSTWSIKPLQYTEPPFVLEKHALSSAVAKIY